MKKIAVLGPKGTYSDIACKEYLKKENIDLTIEYFPSILKVSQAIQNGYMGILPFENTLDGFVMESMDQLISNQFHILTQVKLDIDFAFVSNAKKLEDVKSCYVQFKAYGQCLEFISQYKFSTISTQSNAESMQCVLNADSTYAAIVPVHMLKEVSFALEILHVADSKANETRFFVLSKEQQNPTLDLELEASLVITSILDRPGVLFEILKEFHDVHLNLKSIMSRPMKTEMGEYQFYIECSLTKDGQKDLDNLVSKFSSSTEFKVIVLGIYNKL